MKRILFTLLSLLWVSQTAIASTDLAPKMLLYPQRLVLNNNTYHSTITISNNGNVIGNYKVEVIDRRMTEDGRIIDAKDPILEHENLASKYVRVSPRRFTLNPGEYQNIRVIFRKKQLKDGEYRAHLKATLLPNSTLEPHHNAEDSSVSLNVRTFFSNIIPLFYEKGRNLSFKSRIDDIKFLKKEKKIAFNVHRDGNKSSFGDIEIYYKTPRGKKTLLKKFGSTAVYYPLAKRRYSLDLNEKAKLIKPEGSIQVLYKQDNSDAIIAQAERQL